MRPTKIFSSLKVDISSWAWWCTPVFPVLGRLRQEDCEFQASLGYTERLSLKKKKKKRKEKEKSWCLKQIFHKYIKTEMFMSLIRQL
jgi:hypothetical protein